MVGRLTKDVRRAFKPGEKAAWGRGTPPTPQSRKGLHALNCTPQGLQQPDHGLRQPAAVASPRGRTLGAGAP